MAVAPERLEFRANAYGRPELLPAQCGGRRISFNLSHTPELVILGVSIDRPMGVDVEHIGAGAPPPDVARRVLCPWERVDPAAVPEALRRERFYRYWTLKEAYAKARGMGLSLPLDAFGFRFLPEGLVEMAAVPALGDSAARWRFRQLRPASGYLATVCVERGADPAHGVALTCIAPLVGERATELSLVCASR